MVPIVVMMTVPVMVMVVVVIIVMFVFSLALLGTETTGGGQDPSHQEAECTATRRLFAQPMKLHR